MRNNANQNYDTRRCRRQTDGVSPNKTHYDVTWTGDCRLVGVGWVEPMHNLSFAKPHPRVKSRTVWNKCKSFAGSNELISIEWSRCIMLWRGLCGLESRNMWGHVIELYRTGWQRCGFRHNQFDVIVMVGRTYVVFDVPRETCFNVWPWVS